MGGKGRKGNLGPVVIKGPTFDLGEPASAGVQHSRSIISETRSRCGNAFKTVKTAVTKTFRDRRAWDKILAAKQLEDYLHSVKCMTDPGILSSRKRCVEMPTGNRCNINPAVLPRPLDKCELTQMALNGWPIPEFYHGVPGLVPAPSYSNPLAGPPTPQAPGSLRQSWWCNSFVNSVWLQWQVSMQGTIHAFSSASLDKLTTGWSVHVLMLYWCHLIILMMDKKIRYRFPYNLDASVTRIEMHLDHISTIIRIMDNMESQMFTSTYM